MKERERDREKGTNDIDGDSIGQKIARVNHVNVQRMVRYPIYKHEYHLELISNSYFFLFYYTLFVFLNTCASIPCCTMSLKLERNGGKTFCIYYRAHLTVCVFKVSALFVLGAEKILTYVPRSGTDHNGRVLRKCSK